MKFFKGLANHLADHLNLLRAEIARASPSLFSEEASRLDQRLSIHMANRTSSREDYLGLLADIAEAFALRYRMIGESSSDNRLLKLL